MNEERSVISPSTSESIFAWGAATDVGKLRNMNQDFHAVSNSLFLVADGMGGHRGGEIASEIATRAMIEEQKYSTVETFREQIVKANIEVRIEAESNPEYQGMGTTLCGLTRLYSDNDEAVEIALANIGDSRIYLLSAEKFSQITIDHSLVEEMRREGKITEQQAANHPQRNIITRALGITTEAHVDCWRLPAQKNDRFLLCTDGLTNEVHDTEIHGVLQSFTNPQEAAQELIDLANTNGGNDNITVVVVDVKEGKEPLEPNQSTAIPETTDLESPQVEIHIQGQDRDDYPSESVEWVTTPQNIRKLIITLLVMLLVVGLFVGRYARDNYFVSFEQVDNISIENSQILIFQGRTNSILWFDPTIEERRPILGRDLDETMIEEIRQKPQFESLQEAIDYLDVLQNEIAENRQKTD
ncbi:MAG: hypothetical protein CL470_09135 [Acidimicrobiaceae bacterium]|nr:hypothetical protein [Acidimicrobiaceae bacterium]|tara:strand:- start:226 stop:1467 length:1242 start_codon:yes stop_codon:yes gene_type:complete